MFRWLKRLVGLTLVLAFCAALVYAFLPQPVAADVGLVTRGPLRVTVEEDGKSRIQERYIVSAPLTGRLQRIELRAGDPIIAGETLLATIEPVDPTLLDTRTVAQAELRVKAAETALKKVAPMLELAKVSLQHAESEANRIRQLTLRSTATQQELENAELLERAKAEELKSARFAEEIARFELDLARAALLRSQPNSTLPSEKWQFEIRAPITGSVLRVIQESAGVVQSGQELLQVGNPADLELEIDVLSSDAVQILPNTRVLLEEWGGEVPLEGRVRLVEPSAFTKISALGVEEQRVNVIVDLVDPPERRPTFGDGYRVEAKIIIWEQADVLKVPTSALFRVDADWAVFLLKEGRAVRKVVEIGRRNGLEAEVKSGLTAGETVIVHPSDRVQDGVQIVPR